MNNFETFLTVAKGIVSKNDASILNSIVKKDNVLSVCNLKEWLFMNYATDEKDSAYDFTMSQAYNYLHTEKSFKAFPDAPEEFKQFYTTNKVSPDQAKSMLDCYKFVSDDITKYYMNGIYFDNDNIVSTDGSRMYYKSEFSGFPAKIIPEKKTISFMLKKATNIYIGEIGKWVVFHFIYKGSAFRYYVEAIEGKFPNWKKVIPEAQTYSMGIPNMAQWEKAYKIIKTLKGEYSAIKFTGSLTSNMVDIHMDERLVDSIKWGGFYNKCLLEDERVLIMNPKYLNDCFMLDDLENIQYREMGRAFTFNYKNGVTMLLMPCRNNVCLKNRI